MIKWMRIFVPCVLMFALILFFTGSSLQAQSVSDHTSSFEFSDFRGFGATVTIDQPEYYTDFMPPGWRPPVIRMVLKVFNYSLIPVTFDFTTSQRFDFAIYNRNGVEVWRWSADKGFWQVLGQVTLNPGESVSYKTSHRFVDDDGEAMPVDLYTLEGELTATDLQLWVPRTMKGQVSFWHKYVY